MDVEAQESEQDRNKRLKRNPMSQAQRDSIALSRCEDLLDKQALGKKRLSNATLAAIRIRYDKLRPALSSVEQTVHNADDLLTQDQIDERFQQLIDANPGMLQRLLARQAKANPGLTDTDSVVTNVVTNEQDQDKVA